MLASNSRQIQLDNEGRLKHFLTIEGLPKSILEEILDTALSMYDVRNRSVKKLPLLRGRTVVNLFFESSTRTRTTFELAAKLLSADVLNLNISTSATTKGESLRDTLRNIEAMYTDMFVVRHASSGAAHFIASQVKPHISVLNAGDGRHSHPTQAMLDMLTIRQHKGPFQNLSVAIIGDILHSRVARSQIHALNTLGVGECRAIGPITLLPENARDLGVHIYRDIKQGLKNVDVVILLRLQQERMSGALLPSSDEFFKLYGLTQDKLDYAKDDAIIMHPGPINRGVELESSVADGPRSVILQQVEYGIAVRMAVLSMSMQNPARGV